MEKEDTKTLLYVSLNMRINFIETGDISWSRNDAIIYNDCFRDTDGKEHIKIKELSTCQEELVQRMKKLADDLINGNVRVENVI